MLKFWVQKEKFCSFLWTFEINGLSLRSVFQHSKHGNTQQAGIRIHSCILSITKNHICLCYEERKHSNAMTVATSSRPSISNGKQRYIPSRCPVPTVAAATLCQSPCSTGIWNITFNKRKYEKRNKLANSIFYR